MKWRLLVGDKAPGREQMALDAFLLAGVESGSSPPTLRLYGWSRPCVTLGHHQDFHRELDEGALSRLGWDWAYRATGGRAVLHDDEITYAVMAGADAAPWCASTALATRAIAEALVAAMGLPEAEAVAGEPPDLPRSSQGPSRLCFASKSRDEIAYRGRKLVGSAQRRLRRSFLQHGSLPLSGGQSRLLEAQPMGEKTVSALRAGAGVREAAAATDAHWSEALGHPIGFTEARAKLAENFAAALQVEAQVGGLTEREAESWGRWRAAAERADAAKILVREAAGLAESGERIGVYA